MSAKSQAEIHAKFARIATPEQPFRFASGAKLDDLTLAYETHGKLNADEEQRHPALSRAVRQPARRRASAARSPAPTSAGRRTASRAGGTSSSDPARRWTPTATSSSARTTSAAATAAPGRLRSIRRPASPTARRSLRCAPAMWCARRRCCSTISASTSCTRSSAPPIGGLMALNFATMFPERVKLVMPIASGLRTTVLTRLHCVRAGHGHRKRPAFPRRQLLRRRPRRNTAWRWRA